MKWTLVFILTIIGFVSACGGPWFPKCDDPKHPCPPMPEPAPMAARDAGADG